MGSPTEWLIDVHSTVLRVDFAKVYQALADIAGVPSETFRTAYGQVVDDVMTYKGIAPEAMTRVLASCGVEPRPQVVDALVGADQRLLIEHTEVFQDAIDFLHRLRAAGGSSALVSNCGDHTRGLLAHYGFDALVDELVLSSEVGLLKPDPRIFQIALERLGAGRSRPSSSTTRSATAARPGSWDWAPSSSCAGPGRVGRSVCRETRRWWPRSPTSCRGDLESVGVPVQASDGCAGGGALWAVKIVS
jgi:FMN phosphatase YigB (HAD superfamily)